MTKSTGQFKHQLDAIRLAFSPTTPAIKIASTSADCLCLFLHQIPEPTATFKGRQDELDELTEAIRESIVAISGVRGMGGIGKTALALKMAPLLQWW